MHAFALIEHSLLHAFDFKGRAGRAEYWYWLLFAISFGLGLHFLGVSLPMVNWASKIWLVVAVLVSIPLTVRRLHDIDHSGNWYFVVPGAILITIAFASVAPELASHLLFMPVVLLIIFYGFVGLVPGPAAPNQFGAPFPPAKNKNNQ